MAKRTRRKKNERKDFQKVKFKVGKQKPKGLNATDTSFKSKGIALQTQFQISSAAQTSTRGLGVKEICSLLGHTTSSQRTFAFNELTDFLSHYPSLACDNLGNLLNAILPRLMDEDHRLRTRCYSALTLLCQMATDKSPTALEPFSSVFVNYVICGLTHVEAAIAVSSLSAVDLLTDHLPLKTCVEESVRLLKALIAMISVIGQSKKKKREVQLLSTGHFANGPARLSVLWRMAKVVELVCLVEKAQKEQREYFQWDIRAPLRFVVLPSPLAVDLTPRPVNWITEVDSSLSHGATTSSISFLSSNNKRPVDDLVTVLLQAVFLVKVYFPSTSQEQGTATLESLAGHCCAQDVLQAIIAYFHHLFQEQEMTDVKFPSTVFLQAVKVVTEENPVTVKIYKRPRDKTKRDVKLVEMKRRIFPEQRNDRFEASNTLNRNALNLLQTYLDFIVATNGNTQLRHKVEVELSKLSSLLDKIRLPNECRSSEKKKRHLSFFNYEDALVADKQIVLHDHNYNTLPSAQQVEDSQEFVEEVIESEIVFPVDDEEGFGGMDIDNHTDEHFGFSFDE